MEAHNKIDEELAMKIAEEIAPIAKLNLNFWAEAYQKLRCELSMSFKTSYEKTVVDNIINHE